MNSLTMTRNSVETSCEGNCFIYALVRGDDIVYIGQTNNFEQRISYHINDKSKVFDSHYVEAVSEDHVNELETFLILANSPVYNLSKNVNFKRRVHTPISHHEILRRLIENK